MDADEDFARDKWDDLRDEDADELAELADRARDGEREAAHDRRATDRSDRERRTHLHGRPVSPAVVEHQAQSVDPLRSRIAAIAPQDPEGTTTSKGEEPW